MTSVLGEEEWRIGRAQPACSACEAAFVEGQVFCSGIFEEPASEGGATVYARRDYCVACWQAPSAFACWRTRARTESEDDRPRAVDAPLLLEFLRRLVEADRPEDRPLAYCLGLYLVRKKKLLLDGSVRRSDGVYLKYRIRDPDGDPETIEVLEPPMTDEDIDRAEETLASVLSSGTVMEEA